MASIREKIKMLQEDIKNTENPSLIVRNVEKKKIVPKTKEIVTEILERVCSGQSLSQIASDPDMPSQRTMMAWINSDANLYDLYLKARQLRIRAFEEEIISIADDTSNDVIQTVGKNGKVYSRVNKGAIERSELRVKTRMWLMEKLGREFQQNQEKIVENKLTNIQIMLPDNSRPIITLPQE